MFWELAIRNKYINWLILETSRKLAIGLEAGNLSIGCFSKYLQQQCLFHSNFIFIQKFLVLIYHQLQKDRKVRLRVGTSDYEWQQVTTSIYELKFGWQRWTTGDCELLLVTKGQNTSDCNWLRVTITFDCHTCDHTWWANVVLKIHILHYPWIITEGVCLKMFQKFAEFSC